MTKLGVASKTLDELESHLRETVNQLVRSGTSETEAFRSAVAQLGTPPMIASEFHKLNSSTWLSGTRMGLMLSQAEQVVGRRVREVMYDLMGWGAPIELWSAERTDEPNVARLMRIAEDLELLERLAFGEEDPVRQDALYAALAEAKSIG